jgi:hypothetical protein
LWKADALQHFDFAGVGDIQQLNLRRVQHESLVMTSALILICMLAS